MSLETWLFVAGVVLVLALLVAACHMGKGRPPRN